MKKGKEMISLQKKLMNMITVGISFVVIIFFSSVLAWGGTSVFGGELPLIDGATIIKERFEQGVGRLELEVNTAPNEVADFYQKAMEEKGWPSGKVMSIGNKSILMLNNQGDKFILKTEVKNEHTQVVIILIQKSQTQNIMKPLPSAGTAAGERTSSAAKSKTVPKNSGVTTKGSPLTKSPGLLPKNTKGQPAIFPIKTPVADHYLEMFLPFVRSNDSLELDQPLLIKFTQAIDPVFFKFDIKPKSRKWTVQWSSDFSQVTLVPDTPLEPEQTLQLTANVLGGPSIDRSIQIHRLSAYRQLAHDLKIGRIDINQAARYRVFSLFKPSQVPKIYRPTRVMPSGTPILKKVQKDFDKLDEATQRELRPYFLSPLNPKSFWHKKLQKSTATPHSSLPFSLIPMAWAAEPPLPSLIQKVYITENGYRLVILGPSSEAATVQLVYDIIKRERIYERFKELLGRDAFTATKNIYIYIFNALTDEMLSEDEEEDENATDDIAGYAGVDWDTNESMILISASACTQENELGSTLAHELFHEFQRAFIEDSEWWLEESTAVWSQDDINKTWNTEQHWIEYAFDEFEMARMERLHTDSDNGVYGVYLFPYYLTNVNPKTNSVIRLIWENKEDGYSGIDAIKNSVGDFDDVWKEYCLATLDEDPKDGLIPDIVIKKFGGENPLILSTEHGYQTMAIDNHGLAVGHVVLGGMQAGYFNVTNSNQGADAPAIRFDLTPFQKYPDKVSVQAIIHYRDGRKEYEDWTGRDERLFCLSVDRQNFYDIYIVIGSSDDKLILLELLAVTPEPTSRCYSGTVTLTRKYEKRSNVDTTSWITPYVTRTESLHSSENRSATLRLELDLSERILPETKAALEQMQSKVKDVKPDRVQDIRGYMENIIKIPYAHLDKKTGLMKVSYRVKNCRIGSAGGHSRSHTEGETTDQVGMSAAWETNSNKQWTSTGLNEKTLKRIKQEHIRVDIYYEPESGKILWVHIPQLDIDMHVTENSNGHYTHRTEHGYETTPKSNNDSRDVTFNMTFNTGKKDEKGLPMDPVWQAKQSTGEMASGGASREFPSDKQWSEPGNSGTSQLIVTETFEWSINLSKNN